jgi:hypothetical protein
MRGILAIVLSIGFLLGLSGCATENTSSRPGVSSIPWNRPAKWEGGGPLGGQMSAMRGY